MHNKGKNILIILMFVLFGASVSYNSNVLKAKNAEISALQSQLQEKEAQLAEKAAVEARLRGQAEAVQAHIKARGEKGLALIERLPEINTLAELLDVYQPQMDGAVSEGYGAALARLTEKEGLQVLIGILAEKNKSAAREVAFLLFAEYVIQENAMLVETMRAELEAISLKSSTDIESAVVNIFLGEAYWAKDRMTLAK